MTEPLYTADEMRAAEAGHEVPVLMQRAGRAVAEAVIERFPSARRIVGVCGGGANGGDGRIALNLLKEAGRDAEESNEVEGADLVLDALFGTGFHGAPRAEAAALIERINASDATVVAVDIPSGVDASTGEVPGAAVEAELIVTFHGRKVGLAVAPGRHLAGEVVVADIGLTPAGTAHALVTRDILRLVPAKTPRDNKYSAGSVLVVGGAPGMTGAACLVAEAAFRADAGYVMVAVPQASLAVVETKLLEPVKGTWAEVDRLAEKARAVAVGPGLGRTDEARALVVRLLRDLHVPVVVDADGLFGLEPFDRAAPTVLTPHAGELARLLGEQSAWVDAHRLEALRRAVERFRCTVLLKGADTLVAAPGEQVLVCDLGTPALATAGTGDVLTGIVAAFLAKGLQPRLAAAAAAAAGGVAAELLDPQRGAVAGDLLTTLPRALA
ncbi:MAG TPA: NAD(P)H-hydrate dehydratase [Gaiellaceae bacterium]|nr:NAD(P)H-hydrate dehydratase [Gaiellaceae bacterium]